MARVFSFRRPTSDVRRFSPGFSLVEVLVALLLVSISVAVIIEGYGSALNANKEAYLELTDTELVHLSKQQIEASLAEGRTAGEFMLGDKPVTWQLIGTQAAPKLRGIDSATGRLDYGTQVIELKQVEFSIGRNARPMTISILSWRRG